MEREQQILDGALALGRRYDFDEVHARQVARLSLSLFDQLRDTHELGDAERRILLAAAVLHDIGKFIASRRHHKHSHYVISNSELPGFDREEVELAAVVARYHRRSKPSEDHPEFAALSRKEQQRVRWLAVLLRIADALDSGHQQRVDTIAAHATKSEVELLIEGRGELKTERRAVRRKGRMLEQVFDRKLRVSVNRSSD